MDLSNNDYMLPMEMLIAVQLLVAARNNAVQTVMRNTWQLIRRRRNLLRKKQEIRRKRHRYHCQRLFPYFMNTVVANFPIRQSIKKFRTIRWWEMARNSLSDKDWIEHFHMSKDTYSGIVHELEKSNLTVLHAQKGALDIGTKCAVAIFKLTNFNNYTSVGNLFGIHSSTVFFCISRFCKAVNEILLPQYLRMPTLEEAVEISSQFEEMCCLPQVLGAIDCTHIPVNVQKDRRNFLNPSGWPSFMLQALVDNRYIFRDISCNNPGVCDELKVFTDSELYKNIQDLLPSSPKFLGETEMDLYFVGNIAYPLLPWLITPHLDPTDEAKKSFNIYLNTALDVVQIAFNRLKGRFRCLSRKSEFSHSSLPMIITTCAVLHNVVEVAGDEFSQGWFDSVREGEAKYPQPTRLREQSLESAEGNLNRDFLTQFMADNFELVTQTEVVSGLDT